MHEGRVFLQILDDNSYALSVGYTALGEADPRFFGELIATDDCCIYDGLDDPKTFSLSEFVCAVVAIVHESKPDIEPIGYSHLPLLDQMPPTKPVQQPQSMPS